MIVISRILFAGFVVATSLSAQGRYDYHPHVGDIHPSIDPSVLVSSNGFNIPDGEWNNGEGFLGSGPNRGVDRGGMGELDEGSTLVPGDIHIQQGWSPFSILSPDADMASVYRLVGFLYPENLYNALSPAEQSALSGYHTKSAFEVFVPETYDPQLGTIVTVRVRPTVTGPVASDPFNRFQPQARPITGDYSGQDFNSFPPYTDADDGLSWNESAGIIDRADTERMAALSGPASGFNIIAAYIVPPDNDQHGMLTIQRTLQLTRALQYLLSPAFGNLWPGSEPTLATTWNGQSGNQWPLPVALVGGSNGALITQYLVAHFPDLYSGGACMRMGPSLRATANVHETWEYIAAGQAAGFSTSFHRIQNVHPLTAYLRSRVPSWFVAPSGMYARGDSLFLWLQGQMPRPMLYVVGDEDTVYNGESSLWRFLEGTPGGANTYHPNGAITSPTTGKGPGHVYWSIAEKNGHEPFSRMTLPAALTDTGSEEVVDESLRALPYFFDEVIASWSANPTFARPNLTAVSAPPAAGGSDHDPQDWVLNRASVAARRSVLPTTSHPGLLTEATGFVEKQRGLGTYLGMNESLVADSHSRKIFVGSADGVVTALVPNQDTSLSIRARFGKSPNSPDPASLGYAVRGIVENEKWIVVALQRRLLVFDRHDQSTPIAQVDLDWDEYSPKNLHLTKGLFGGSDTHLVYSSHVGELVVRRLALPSLPVVAWSSQPSITSLVVTDAAGAEPGYSNAMLLATESGHVVEFCMSKQIPSHVVVTAVSDRIGAVRDLVEIPDPKSPGVAAIVQGSRVGGFTFMSFRKTESGFLQVKEEIVLDGLPTTPMIYGSAEQAFHPQIENLGSGLFAILIQGVLFVVGGANATEVPAGSAAAVELNLVPGALYAVSIEVDDVNGDGNDDLVLCTESGQVAWLPRSTIISGDVSAIEQAVLGDDWFPGAGTPTPGKYGTASVSSTWGMAWGVDSYRDELATPGTSESLQVVDQCGRRWALEPDGTPRYLRVVKDSERVGTTEYPSIRLKPFRDLAWIGTRAPTVLQTAEATFDLGAHLNPALDQRSELYRPSFWQAVYLIARNPALWLERYDGTTAGLVPWFAMRPDTGLGAGRGQPFDDGYLPFCLTGDTIEVTGEGIYSGIYGYYWNGTRLSLPGILRGFKLDNSNPLSVASTPWGSSSSNSNVTTWTIIDPPPFPNESDKQAHLRHVTATGGVFDTQSLRIGKWDSGSPLGPFPLRVVTSTMGGRVIVNNPDPTLPEGQCITAESEDRGLGGLALCVEDVHGNDLPTIFAGTIFTHEGHFPGGSVSHDLVSSLHVYRLDGTSGEQLVELDTRVFTGAGSDAKLFGLCGIATGNLIDDADGIQDELILTTMNGDLVVYDLDGVGENVTIGATPLYWQVFDGSMGVCNSIIVRDPEGGEDTDGELYVASSMGVRKFTFTP